VGQLEMARASCACSTGETPVPLFKLTHYPRLMLDWSGNRQSLSKMNTVTAFERGNESLPAELYEKYQRLQNAISHFSSVLVAFSGGVDSSLIAKVALDVLGCPNVLAAIAISASLGAEEEQSAVETITEIGLAHIKIETNEVEDPRYAANPINRCYFCKEHVYGALVRVARERGFDVVLDGFNAEDTMDFRPGRKAGRELGVRSPLHEASFSKDDVRSLARHLGLSTWHKPQMACLSSRVEYGVQITPMILKQVDRAEAALRQMGFDDLRVRHHDELARVEVEQTVLPLALARQDEIIDAVKAAGYTDVTIDPQGLRHGSMNEGLKNVG
jgi:pyridinium-3,5-biscarboxylic acid mononucleotide sulfurtransferase